MSDSNLLESLYPQAGAFLTRPPLAGPASLGEDLKMLTERFVTRFYQHDWRWCLPYCHPEIVYYGSTSGGVAKGIGELRNVMQVTYRRYNPSLPIIVSIDTSALGDGRVVLVTLHYFLVTDPANGEIKSRSKRGTLLWLQTEGGPRLRHAHLSIPVTPERYDEELSQVSSDVILYAKMLVDQLLSLPNITLRDVEGNIHRLSAVEVRYVEASKQKTIIHTFEGDIVIREGFAKTVAHFGDRIMPVHRSFAVNLSYVRTVRSDCVMLADGTRIPLPQRRSRSVRNQLEKALREATPRRDDF